MNEQMQRTIGQSLVLVSGLILVLIITVVTEVPEVLFALILVGGMLVNVSEDPLVALKEGVVVLLVNITIGIIFLSLYPDPNIAWAMLGSWFLMVRID